MNMEYISDMNRTCVQCGSPKYYCKGMCKRCYTKQLVPSGWCKRFDRCVKCQSSEYPHVAHGLCSRCYHTQETRVLCACGCGLTVPKNGNRIKRFRKGHWLRAQGQGSKFQEAHRDRFTGSNNPQYGKFGKDHPAYGHETTQETRELRRQVRLKALCDRKVKPTDIEIILSDVLDELNILHKPQEILCKKFVVDEFLPDFGLVIEAHGGYWHGDPRRFSMLDSVQSRNIKRDASKRKYLETCGYAVLILWEKELKENREWCKQEILSVIENLRLPLVQNSV